MAVTTPDSIGDQIEDITEELFQTDVLDEVLKLKCRYQYIHAKIESMQRRDEPVDDRLMDTMRSLEDALMDRDIRPSNVLKT